MHANRLWSLLALRLLALVLLLALWRARTLEHLARLLQDDVSVW
jgi:hypothetical protein